MKNKAKEWSKRYLPPELFGLAVAYVSFLVTVQYTDNLAFLAYASSMGDFAAYYLFILARSFMTERRFMKNAINLLIEFGPAECFDSFLIRPIVHAFSVSLFGFGPGILIGKIATDVLFYVQVIFCYEKIVKKNTE